MTHEPECPVGKPAHATARWLCVCAALRDAYQRGYATGYNDHARTVQHWQDTHGAYRPPPPSPGASITVSPYQRDSGGPVANQHGEGTNP